MIRKSELTIVSGSNVISCSLSRIDSGPDAVSDVLSGMVCGSDAVACVLSCIASSAQTSSAGVALRPSAEHRAIDRRNRFDKIYPPFLIGVGLISSLFGNILPKQNPMDLHRAFFFSMHADHKHGCGCFFVPLALFIHLTDLILNTTTIYRNSMHSVHVCAFPVPRYRSVCRSGFPNRLDALQAQSGMDWPRFMFAFIQAYTIRETCPIRF